LGIVEQNQHVKERSSQCIKAVEGNSGNSARNSGSDSAHGNSYSMFIHRRRTVRQWKHHRGQYGWST